jgi:hypothetical protein
MENNQIKRSGNYIAFKVPEGSKGFMYILDSVIEYSLKGGSVRYLKKIPNGQIIGLISEMELETKMYYDNLFYFEEGNWLIIKTEGE